MIHNGWEFFIVNPFSETIYQSTQELYIENYNKCYSEFINSLTIPNPVELFTGDSPSSFMYFIDCGEIGSESDIINKNSEYGFKFLRSKFFEKKSNKIKRDLGIYYAQWNIKINLIYKDSTKYYIEIIKF